MFSTKYLLCTAAAFLAAFSLTAAAEQPKVLVYCKSQAGKGLYVHDNIAFGNAAIQKLGKENKFDVEVTDDPAAFTDANLKRFKVLVFNNTNNEIFDNEEEKAAFQRYIRGGGGFVGIHSACGGMRKWPWMWELMGGNFKYHPKLQKFTIRVKDATNPSTRQMPASFEWTDEFYFLDHRPDDLHVLLAGDLATLDDPKKQPLPGHGNEIPLSWCHEFEGGRAWFTALGHQKEHYNDPLFTQHILGGIYWAMGRTESAK